jgi:hypothetical protein
MIRALLIFVALTGAIMMTVTAVRHMNGKELWSTAKTLGFSAGCALLSMIILVGLVILF